MAQSPSLRQLSYFVAVAEELNFRRAAERLCITQPPLTRQIQALEAMLGARLFDRDRRGVQLTEAGQRFLAQARALVQQVAQAVNQFQPSSAAPQPPVLRLGITTVVDVGLFGGLGAAFDTAWPGRQLRIQRQISARLIRDLHRGALDLAVIGLPSRTEGLVLTPLGDDPLMACLSSRHPLARRRRVPLQALAADTLFWFDRRLNPAYFDHCEQVFHRLGFHPPRLAEPAEHPVLLGLIAEGRGFALVPQSLNTVRRSGVVFRRLVEEDELRIRLAAAWPADRPPARADDWVALLKAQWAGPR
ncbi:LysR family transcriptional regulator [Aquincola tertiaricarbonis]|uniref:LysR family transcriptional regulator n=1 Tax=Aquincola tertiaricarbonis TaxID=391953 RepID=A0ABY4SE52_AQUTE|nr:LysR family transcriptional regulator [Aquincola tertiaricarbonis]URI11284.1 LysR family transcriptional regulator [Aquincola tertiaricarbonis]